MSTFQRPAFVPRRKRLLRPASRSHIGALVLVLLAACRPDAPSPTEPQRSSAAEPAPDQQVRDSLSRMLPETPGGCLTAARTPGGQYRARSVVLHLPAAVGSAADGLTRFAYRGWAANAPDPIRVVVCNLPNTPAARAHFARLVRGRAMSGAEVRNFAREAGVPGTDAWTSDQAPEHLRGAPSSYTIDGRVDAPDTPGTPGAWGTQGIARSYAVCDPNAIVPEAGCDAGGTPPPYCDPAAVVPEPGCATVPEDPPDPNFPPEPPFQPGALYDLADHGAAQYLTIPGDWWGTLTHHGPDFYFLSSGALLTADHSADLFGRPPFWNISGWIDRRFSFFWGLWNGGKRIGGIAVSGGTFGPGHQGPIYSRVACDWSRGYYRAVTVATTLELNGPEQYPFYGVYRYHECPGFRFF